MRKYFALTLWRRICLAFLSTALLLSSTQAQERAPAKAPVDREADTAAIRVALQSFTKAFATRDSKALAAHWTADAEYQRGDDAAIRGRDALERSFAEFFARTPEIKAETRSASLRFVGRDAAIDEGVVTVHRGPADPTTRALYQILFVREDGRWRIGQLKETVNAGDSIDDLAWLVGEWKSQAADGAEIHSVYSWSRNKKFINVNFEIKEKILALSGSQVIGVDPASGKLRTWTFEADGGVGETEWTRDGDHWVLEASGTLIDGRTLVATNLLRRTGADTFTWQSIDREIGDESLPDLPPVKVTRVKPQ